MVQPKENPSAEFFAQKEKQEFFMPRNQFQRMIFALLTVMADNLRFSKHTKIRENGYLKYDNYDAIEVPYTDAIPKDYSGIMGVPISFLEKYSPEQFKIIGATESEGKGFSMGLWNAESKVAQPLVKGERQYKRIFIKFRSINK